MNFNRINNIFGWIVCFIACFVYIKTMEATGSLWDCGEFASSANKLQIPHSPGAPFFVLVGRLFMIPFDGANAATGANLLSAISSGFTILFLFWTITHYAKKMLVKTDEAPTTNQTFTIMAAGVIGGLAFTFSDTFWYSAVEAEVYAFSSFFTALLFWIMVKWEQDVTKEQAAGIRGHFTKADRWIVLVFFLMGLSIGVHLLNLLVTPAIVMIYYFKRYKASTKGIIIAFIIGCIITGFLQKAMIQWSIKGAGNFDVLFVNSFGLPYFSGFAFFFILVFGALLFLVHYGSKNNHNFLQLGAWSFAFILLGTFTSYCTTLARSNANPALDMSNVDNPINLVSYLAREQYGDWPILYGQDFTAQVESVETTETYVKTNGHYEKNGRKSSYKYNAADKHPFPRMWDASNDQGRADYYAAFAGIGKDEKTGEYERAPTVGENISFAMAYQLNWMYWRYFMWNFAGKQNDNQGITIGNVRDGNWLSGIGFIDNVRLGNQSKMPTALQHNKANNKLYFLPFILGVLGLILQVSKSKNDALVVSIFFFFTGLAIVLYLNAGGNQPRERDYAFVGSFYVFAIWIGLGVIAVKDSFEKLFKKENLANYAAAALCMLAVPVLMANQEWDDHDRSQKTIARDLATAYLESCAPNAILITFGDNDTYPLWYAQEVEGVRRDIRVINYSLLGTDWYINQLRYKVNQSDPIDVIFTESQIEGATRDVLYFQNKSNFVSMDLYTMLKDWSGSDEQFKTRMNEDGSILNIFPCKEVTIPVDEKLVRANGTVDATEAIDTTVRFTMNKNMLFKNETAVLAIIAANKWKRPIYFTTPMEGGIGFRDYLRQDGMTYRLVPKKSRNANTDWAYDKIMKHFKFGGAEKGNVYFDEENRRHLNSLRLTMAQIAGDLAQKGEMVKAKQVIDKADKGMLESNFPYAMPSRGELHNQYSMQMMIAAYKAEYPAMADKIAGLLEKDLKEQLEFYATLEGSKADFLANEKNDVERLLGAITQLRDAYKSGKFREMMGMTPAIASQKASTDTAKPNAK